CARTGGLPYYYAMDYW
nr:immunoglobulin heavy chain junction region [Mus musculus]MBK4195151.1 immunoglobulin heavy chain junction region [Mus musculus]